MINHPEQLSALRTQATAAYLDRDYDTALLLYQQILNLDPQADDILMTTGEILLFAGKLPEAIHFLERAVAANPRNAIAWYNMALALQQLSEWELAEKSIQAALQAAPQMAKAHFIAGNIFRYTGRYLQAIESYKASLRIEENYADAWNNLGLSLAETDRLNEAAGAYLNALKHDYTMVSAHSNLGILLLQAGQLGGARRACERALSFDPNNYHTLNTMGSIYSQLGQHEEAIGYFRKALEINPEFWMGHSNMLFCVLHKDGTTLAETLKLHHEWYEMQGRQHARENVSFKNSRDPERRLRVGFVSGDFRSHPVGYFINNTLERLITEDKFDIYFYANQFEGDEDYFAQRFRKMAGANWRLIWEIKLEKVLQQIEDDQIDILFDLTGHNSRHRLDVFCARGAPVQVTWAGYMATTGVPQIDWLLGDNIQTPEQDQPYYTERLYQLPHSFIGYTPPPDAPPLCGEPPCIRNGYISFASFNKPNKVTERAIRIWSRILTELPNSKLLMKFSGLTDSETIEFFSARFENYGVRRAQLTFENSSPHHELMARYNEIDIALDPMPYTGSTTTLEALWMATPLVTLPGQIFPARHAASYLTSLGAVELIAADEEDYVKKIVALAKDPQRIGDYKRNLREQMRRSPLCDQDKFVPVFSDALRYFWRDYCSNRP